MTFWYIISGSTPNYLSFSVRNLETNKLNDIWYFGKTDNKNEWNYGSFGFYVDYSYSIQIEAKIGGTDGIVALDDIIFKESQFCGTQPYQATAGFLPIPYKSTTTTPTPSSTLVPPMYDCDFESGFCNYKNGVDSALSWIRNQGRTSNSDTGPRFDHT